MWSVSKIMQIVVTVVIEFVDTFQKVMLQMTKDPKEPALLTWVGYANIKFIASKCIQIHVNLQAVLIHPRPDFSGGSMKSPLNIIRHKPAIISCRHRRARVRTLSKSKSRIGFV